MATAFDEAELLDRVDHDLSFLAETVEMLATDGRGLLGQVRQAVAAGDGAALARTAHALKGMISNFCSPATQQRALELEAVGKRGDLSAAPGALAALEAHFEPLVAELLQFVRVRS